MLLQVFSHLTPGIDQNICSLTLHARYQLAEVLDREHPDGRDWRALAKSLDLLDRVLATHKDDTEDDAPLSRVDEILDLWATDTEATIRDLHGQLVKLGRTDAVEKLLSHVQLFVYN